MTLGAQGTSRAAAPEREPAAVPALSRGGTRRRANAEAVGLGTVSLVPRLHLPCLSGGAATGRVSGGGGWVQDGVRKGRTGRKAAKAGVRG